MRAKYFILIWIVLNVVFFITLHVGLWILLDEYDITLWLEETRHFFYYLVFIFSLISLQLTAKIINKF